MMPTGAVEEAFYYGGIMGTMSDSRSETQIMLEGGEQAFYVEARELFRYSTGDLSKDLALSFGNSLENVESKYIVSEIINAAEIQYITITPREIIASDSILLKVALIKMADNTLVYLGVFADAGAYMYKADCNMMVENVVNSIQGGSRLHDTKSKTVNIYGGLEIENDWNAILTMLLSLKGNPINFKRK